jgi:glutathionyl-hydroquinone reductase
VLWDRVTSAIVSNNFPDITIDLGTQFTAWSDPAVDLYPPSMRDRIDALNERVYALVNNAPYEIAGATTREDYDNLRHRTVAMLDEMDGRLADRRYLFGDRLTEADVRLWPTLARFDLGYNPMAGISERRLVDFPHLWAYARDLYQRPAFRETTDFDTFTAFSRGPKPTFLNDAGWRTPVEPYRADWDAPHGRN